MSVNGVGVFMYGGSGCPVAMLEDRRLRREVISLDVSETFPRSSRKSWVHFVSLAAWTSRNVLEE